MPGQATRQATRKASRPGRSASGQATRQASRPGRPPRRPPARPATRQQATGKGQYSSNKKNDKIEKAIVRIERRNRDSITRLALVLAIELFQDAWIAP